MTQVRITAGVVRSAKCPPSRAKLDLFDVGQTGFMLEVRRSGGKTFYQRYRDASGRERQIKIGPANVLTLPEARPKARTILSRACLEDDAYEQKASVRHPPRANPASY